jgi:hypothetical protein
MNTPKALRILKAKLLQRTFQLQKALRDMDRLHQEFELLHARFRLLQTEHAKLMHVSRALYDEAVWLRHR